MCVGTHTTLCMHDQRTTLGMQFFLPPWDQIQVTRLDTRLPGCLLADTHGGLYILLVCLFCLFCVRLASNLSAHPDVLERSCFLWVNLLSILLVCLLGFLIFGFPEFLCAALVVLELALYICLPVELKSSASTAQLAWLLL